MKLTPRQAFGKELRTLRLAAGLTQWEVADQLGYSTAQFVSNWERAASCPPPSAFVKLAWMYGLKPHELAEKVWAAEDAERAIFRRGVLKQLVTDAARAVS